MSDVIAVGQITCHQFRACAPGKTLPTNPSGRSVWKFLSGTRLNAGITGLPLRLPSSMLEAAARGRDTGRSALLLGA